jgi:E3 ubiquitin-protein ligase DOA10
MIDRALTVIALALVVALPVQADTIHKREKRQEKRIEKGEASGRLSDQEAARLRSKEAGLKQEEQAMKNANGGHLSASDRNALRHQENKDSRAIRRQKTDANGN